MRFRKAWIVATKDISLFRKNKYILYSLIAMPVLVGVVVPGSYLFFVPANQASIATLSLVINLTTTYFVIIAVVLPTIIASYSFVGEKVEKSLEPLLATPTTDGELLFGKSIAAFLPCMGATYVGAAIFVTLVDSWSYINLGAFLLPNVEWAVVNGLMAPLACILSVETNIIISSRVNDIRAAQQLGVFAILPIILVMVLASTIQSISLLELSLIVVAAMAVVDVALFYLSKAIFQREEILTKWK
jgi:ABC-2 type transport system permease protein